MFLDTDGVQPVGVSEELVLAEIVMHGLGLMFQASGGTTTCLKEASSAFFKFCSMELDVEWN